MTYLIYTIVIVFVLLLIALFVVGFLLKKQGILRKARLYQDTSQSPGEVLHAKSIPLRGKPDSIIRTADGIVPVEVKTGKTPSKPYPNHVAQLVAYAILVEEHFGNSPPYGVIRYPEKEFKVEIEDVQKKHVKEIAREILAARQSGEEFVCSHPEHN